MKLIIALGNIGKDYEDTRHNFGFMLLDQISIKYSFSNVGIKHNSEIFTGKIDDIKIIAIKPQTFMNLSGRAVISVMNFYKINIEDIIILHDDIDLDLGVVKFKKGGGNAGHNGLKSIDSVIGKNYKRLRLGVGRPENPRYEISDYVLGRFSKKEIDIVNQVNIDISGNLRDYIF